MSRSRIPRVKATGDIPGIAATGNRRRLPSLEQKLAFLASGSSYGQAPRNIAVIETHFAWVFLGPREVYKLKKPLRHGRMHYRTLAQRRRGCRAEFALNLRAAPDVYLGVVPLTMTPAGRLRLGRGGRTVDYLVRMRRLPSRWMLDAVLLRRTITSRETQAVIEMLGSFFDRAHRRPLAPEIHLRRIRSRITETRRSLLGAAGAYRVQISRVDTLQRRCLRLLHAELAARARLLRDGHGDLRPEHVCIRPLAVIDCIEFDAELRRLDPLEEIAFLALEMQRQRRDPAERLLGRYRATRDPLASDALVHFYMSLSAATRARLSAWHVGDPQFPDPRPWLARTHSCLREATWHARSALRLLVGPSRSAGRGPALQQRRQRLAGRDATHR